MEDHQINHKSSENIISLDGKQLFKYQHEGVKFIEDSGGRCLIADEMGVGKTVQSLAFMTLHPEQGPYFLIVKSSLMTQWQREILRWCGEDVFAQIISDSKTALLRGMPVYITSFDMLRRLSIPKNGKPNLKEQMTAIGIKTIIIDECQQIKNSDSARAVEVRTVCKGIDNVIALSGTPIKNNSGEYFSILNILKPEMYPSQARFVQTECENYFNGYSIKAGGLKNPKAFMEKTKKFIIRRERSDVLPDLPQVTRNFNLSDLSKEVEQLYIDTFLAFRDEYNEGGDDSFEERGNILAFLSKMRHITGLSKVEPCCDFVEDFLDSTDRKITVFVHHQDVGELLNMKLAARMKRNGLEAPIQFTASLKSDQKSDIITKYTAEGGPRVMIASTLAAGEGLNLQRWSDGVLLERQWNPANEEQVEGRFIRVGQTSNKVTMTYFIAVGTVDEFFSEIVEKKRQYVTQTLGGEAISWDQSSIMKELAENLANSGGRKWSI
jgi:SWI/SNF-related matrix-associated actin-dependent regulator 1 of chromatin subfamily A